MRITISGLSGCGNTTACKNVAKALGLQVLNYTFRTMAAEKGMPFEEFYEIAASDAKYDYLVEKRQVELAESTRDCVLGSRLSGWAVDDADLRVWLNASLETRAKRIANREGKPFEQVLERIRKRDEGDKARYKALYGVDVDDHDGFDLVVNTEWLTAEQAAALIVAAAKLAKENNIQKPSKIAKRIKQIIAEKLGE